MDLGLSTRGMSIKSVAAIVLGLPAAILTAIWTIDQFHPFGLRVGNVAYLIGLMVYLLACFWLVKAGQRHMAQLEKLAQTDSLCGLPNRRGLHRDVRACACADEEIALAMFNLDGFKTVNDFYGHSVGDRVIKEIAAIMRELCGSDGQAYRLGGDEFAIVMCGPLAGNIIEGTCRRLLVRLAEPIMVDDRSIVLGASIGMARGKIDEGKGTSDLLRQADIAMNASKSRGKMRLTWFSPEFEQNRELQKTIDADLRTALSEGHLALHYQPLIDSTNGKVIAVEALIRWERPDGMRIGPDKFIPVAEETGLIDAIGAWVLRQACTDACSWDDIKLSVNVSVVQLRNPQFPLLVGQILEETGFPAARLEIEVTETFLVGDTTVAGRNLEMLRDFGVGIVLDDYGTGYASIGFLRRFRFEKLKLDRSLIVEAETDFSSRTVMTSSVTMAKALGMQVTAEGIETESHATLARVAGCDQMQGWLYSKAIPADEIANQIDARADVAGGTDKAAKRPQRKKANG